MLSFRDTEECKTYVTSDTHFNHDPKWENPIWKLRGFNSAKEMTDGLIDNINKVVRPNDNLLHLGDFCLNTNPSQFEELLSRINCQNIYLQWGNHPNSHYKNVYRPLVKKILGDNYTEDSEIYPLRYRNIIYIGNYNEVVLNGTFCVLFHYPISIWNEIKHSALHLCGHSHHNYPPTQVTSLSGKVLDVGVDGHDNMPWSIPEIVEVMKKKQFISPGDHHE
jgi:calcineurin-like phosphoesterase family protein